MKRFAYARLLLGAFLPLLFLPACDSGGSNQDPNDHEFQLSISPSSSQSMQKVVAGPEQDTTLNGYSFFYNPSGAQTPGDRNKFLLYLNENETLEERRNQEGLLGFAGYLDGLPSSGEYPIATISSDAYQNGDAFMFILYYDYSSVLDGDIDGLTYYSVIDGTISFDNPSDDRVAGSVDALAEAVRIVDPDTTAGYEIVRDTTNVSGQFQARNAETFLPSPSGSPSPPAP